jgi:hypothetical protein
MSKLTLGLAFALVLGLAGVSEASHGCVNCGIASPQGIAPSAQSVVAVADCGGGCGGHKGFSMPSICLPKISLPKISLPKLEKTTSCEYVLKKKTHFRLVKGGHGGCTDCGPGAYYAPVSSPQGYASPQASGQY